MSYYKEIDGVRYDRKVLELADSLGGGAGGPLTLEDAERLLDGVLDGGASTEIELRTANRILSTLPWEDDARAWFKANLPPAGDGVSPSVKDANQRIRSILGIDSGGEVPDGRVTINAQTFAELDPDGRVATMLDQAFGGDDGTQPVLTIESAAANPNEANPACVVITGRSGFRLTSNPVDAVLMLTVGKGAFDALITFHMGDGDVWHFSDSFPDLPTVLRADEPGADPRSVFEGLDVTNARFIVTTMHHRHAEQLVVPGINFRADVQAGGLLAAVEELAHGSEAMPLFGTVVLPEAGAPALPELGPDEFPWHAGTRPAGIDLQAPLALRPLALGDAMSLSLDAMRVYSPVSWAAFAANDTYRPVVAYTGTLHADGLGEEPIEITLDAPPGLSAAGLTGDFSRTRLAHVDQLAGLLGGLDVAALLPDSIVAKLGTLGLESARLVIGYGEGLSVQQVAVRVGMPGLAWHVLGGEANDALVLEDLACDIDVTSPFRNPQASVTLSGHLMVGGVKVVGKAFAPDYRVFAALADRVTLPLSHLSGALGVSELPIDDLTIDSLSVVVAPGTSVGFALSLADDPQPWTVPLGSGAGLTFRNVSVEVSKAEGAPVAGDVSAQAVIGPATLEASYTIPGDVLIEGELGQIKLSEIVRHVLGTDLGGLDGFDLEFEHSHVRIEKNGDAYTLALWTSVSDIGSVSFAVQKAGSWGFALGGQIDFDALGSLPVVGGALETVTSWFPLDDILFVVSSIEDNGFAFPTANTPGVNAPPPVALPPSSGGLQKGLFVYGRSVFDRKKKVTRMLSELLGIPEGTEIDAYATYLSSRETVRLGLALSTYLTRPKDTESQLQPSGEQAYKWSQLTATLFLQVGEGDDLQFDIEGKLLTRIADQDLSFDLKIAVALDGVFLSTTSLRTIRFDPFKIGQLALEFGISEDGLPSFGFSGEIAFESPDPAFDFNSSVAVLVDSGLPERSMVAGALSGLNLGSLLDHFLDDVQQVGIEVPDFVQDLDHSDLGDFLRTVAIKGPPEGSFTVPASWTAPSSSGNAAAGPAPLSLADALTQYNGAAIADAFARVPDFPRTTPALTVFGGAQKGATGARVWFITAHSAGGRPVHWQLREQPGGSIDVSKEAQLYLVPDPQGVDIGALHYAQGFMVAGRIEVDIVKADVDVEIDKGKGILIDAGLERIEFGSPLPLLTLSSNDGTGGPRLSICTYNRPGAPDETLKAPHFLLDGAVNLLGSSFDVYLFVTSKGAALKLDLDLVDGLSGELTGRVDEAGFDLKGAAMITAPTISLGGTLGELGVPGDLSIDAHVWCDPQSLGATYDVSFSLLSYTANFSYQAKASTHKLVDAAGELEEEIAKKAIGLLKSGTALAEALKKGLIDGTEHTAEQAAETMHNVGLVANQAIEGLGKVYDITSRDKMRDLMKDAGYPTAEYGKEFNAYFGVEEENRKTNEDVNRIQNVHPIDHPLDAATTVGKSGADIAVQGVKTDVKVIHKTASKIIDGVSSIWP